MLQILSKSVHFRRSYIRTREHCQSTLENESNIHLKASFKIHIHKNESKRSEMDTVRQNLSRDFTFEHLVMLDCSSEPSAVRHSITTTKCQFLTIMQCQFFVWTHLQVSCALVFFFEWQEWHLACEKPVALVLRSSVMDKVQ